MISMILIVDFGSQTCHLIGRRLRELGVEFEIVSPEDILFNIEDYKPKGLILSGGPSSVYAKGALLIDKKVFETNLPVLGICYGLQVMAHLLGGQVHPGKKKEYGSTEFHVAKPNLLFSGLPAAFPVWMSHFDEAVKPPVGAVVTGSTPSVKVAAYADEKKKLYGIQFHPEVYHTPLGMDILANFVFKVCGEKPVKKVIDTEIMIANIKKIIGGEKAVCALSGGIDSSVAAVLTHRAIGNNLTCFYVDTGLMRQGETEAVVKTYQNFFQLNLKVLHAEDIFLRNLKGIVDPEKKRKVIGETFIRLFEKEAQKIKAPFLVQGTIYPDVIESQGSKHSARIKTHHNVGGLPEKHGFKIVEPLWMLYKDEVREIARKLQFPPEVVNRHVFPGPGLAVRTIGEVTREKLDILRRADAIVTQEIQKAGLYDKVWMAFAIFTGVKSTGVTGDERKYGETIALRVIESKDTMTADWVRLPYDLLEKIANRIVSEVFEVVRVVYDITTKPPATMEWE
ncbi:glutamine-hydrolyzing GMP synthase [Candidatus Microgenomates bacterium]|nr:glutamine-hydrolyzing GMP synthase [Candidatus Microgenomates bacterium]